MENGQDENPLHSKSENAFTSALLNNFEQGEKPDFKILTLVERTALITNLEHKMKQADWSYDQSDDSGVRQKGHEALNEIKDGLYHLSQQENGMHEARQLWEQYARPLTLSKPDFLSESPELHQSAKNILDTNPGDVLEGTVLKRDAEQIKEMLQEEKQNGNRFVVFLSGTEALKKEDFTGFKSAFDALENAYEKSTDYDRYIARSIPVVENEMDKVLGIAKEKSPEMVAVRGGKSRDDNELNF